MFGRRLVLWLVFAVCLLAGCGGFGTRVQSANRAVQMSFIWPQRSRLIPIPANSVRITLTSGGNTFTQLISRPDAVNSTTSLITFSNIPVGTYSVTATAYPNADGTGTAQAAGSTAVTVNESATTSFSVTMASTVDRVEIVLPSGVLVSRPITLSARAFDAANNQVLVDGSVWTWNLGSNFDVLSSANGQVLAKPLVSGTLALSVGYSEPDSTAKTGNANLTVDDIFYSPGDYGGWDATSEGAQGRDIVGDFQLNQLLVGFELTGPAPKARVMSTRTTPVLGADRLTGVANGQIIALARAFSGRVFAAVLTGGQTWLYAGDRGQNLTQRFVLPSNTLDIAIGANEDVIALVDSGGTKLVRRFNASGSGTDVSITTDSTTRHIAADRYGNIYVDGTTLRRLSPTGAQTTPYTTDTVFDIDAVDGNLYVLQAEGGGLSAARIGIYHTNGQQIATSETNALFFDFDLDGRMSVDPNTADIYLLRIGEDFTLVPTFEVVTMFGG